MRRIYRATGKSGRERHFCRRRVGRWLGTPAPRLRAEIGLRRFGPFIGILAPVLHPALLLVPLLIQGAPEGFKSAESKVRGSRSSSRRRSMRSRFPRRTQSADEVRGERGDDKRDAVGAEMWIVEIEKPTAATVDSDAATLKPDSSPASRAAKPKPEFRTLPEYVKRALRGFEANADGTLELGAGKHYDRYKLSASEPKASGVGYALDDGDRWVCFIGIAGNLRFDDLRRNTSARPSRSAPRMGSRRSRATSNCCIG